MDKNQEELERIIKDNQMQSGIDMHPEDREVLVKPHKLASAILSAGYQKSEPQITYSIEEKPDKNGIYRITNVKIGGMEYVKLSDVEIDENKIRQAIGRAYTTERNSHKVLDTDLAEDIIEAISQTD